MKSTIRLFYVLFVFALAISLQCFASEDPYLIGGPLAGLKLPPQPLTQDDWNEVVLYPGAVEHYRAYYSKYCEVRSFFDQQSQLKIWTAPNIPGAMNAQKQTFAPPIYKLNKNGLGPATEKWRAPVPTIRCGVKAPVFSLDLGTLPVGLYCVRVVGAVPTEKLRPFRTPIFVTMRINDGLNNEINTYRQRITYVDDFYSISEIFFHAVEKRAFKAEVFVDEGSQTELLVSNIVLDDALAGAVRKPIKARMTITSPEDVEEIRNMVKENQYMQQPSSVKPRAVDERLERDALLWNWMPPLNAQGQQMNWGTPVRSVKFGTPEKTQEQIETESGKWIDPYAMAANEYSFQIRFPGDPLVKPDTLLINQQLKLTYSVADLLAGKPLPSPYPVKTTPAGEYWPDPTDPQKGTAFCPIAKAVGLRYVASQTLANVGSKVYIANGNTEAARDAAITLVRFAYQYPTIQTSNELDALMTVPSTINNYDCRCRLRMAQQYWMAYYYDYMYPVESYDRLFNYIHGNEELAQSIHRFIPWVHTSQDVIELLDVYLVQHQAKRLMRYHDVTYPPSVAIVAGVMGDPSVTAPWIHWLFTKTHEYPLPADGIQNLTISATARDGAHLVGSAFYAQEEGATLAAENVQNFVDAGGDRQFDLSDPVRYPKALAQCYWRLNIVTAGMDSLRIGDVFGPDKTPGEVLKKLNNSMQQGWRWSASPSGKIGDARFAWVMKNWIGRKYQSDQQWAEIEKAAATIKRAPWLENVSRSIAHWAGILETGLEHDDYRFRRALYVREGNGIGHDHVDPLDMQIVAHGLPMTIDGGQRSGYSKPNDKHIRIHNTVQILPDNSQFGQNRYGWVAALSDSPGARFMRVDTTPNALASLYSRQVALIDVNEGKGSTPLTATEQLPGAELAKNIVTPQSYVFDVFRVAGGKQHSYCFHAMVEDDFQWNASNTRKITAIPATQPAGDALPTDAEYLSIFDYSQDQQFAAEAPDEFEATWRYSRAKRASNPTLPAYGSEEAMLGVNYDAQSPRKFTRLHLLNARGLHVLRAKSVCINDKIPYQFTNVLARTPANTNTNDLESVFASIIEPFAGEPFIASAHEIKIDGTDKSAQRPVAILVTTTGGRSDLNYAAFSAEKTHVFTTPQSGYKIAGQYAFHSRDAAGLVQATLTGGSTLEASDVRITTHTPVRKAKITSVDYSQKIFTTDISWPATSNHSVIEIGSSDGPMSAYTPQKIEMRADGKAGNRFVLSEGADAYRSRITQMDPQFNLVSAAIPLTVGHVNGSTKNIVASNEGATRFWRATCINNDFYLVGDPIKPSDFPENVLRLWEYGPGDTVRHNTCVSLRRSTAGGIYELNTDVGLVLQLPGSKLQTSTDGITFTDFPAEKSSGWIKFVLDDQKLSGKPIFIKVIP